jgi:type II secretory pathway component PulK
MADAAQRHQEVLIRHGMDESVLAGLVQALADLQAANDGCQAGRNAHVGATAGLHAVRQRSWSWCGCSTA